MGSDLCHLGINYISGGSSDFTWKLAAFVDHDPFCQQLYQGAGAQTHLDKRCIKKNPNAIIHSDISKLAPLSLTYSINVPEHINNVGGGGNSYEVEFQKTAHILLKEFILEIP